MSTPTICPACGRPSGLLLHVVEDGRLLCIDCYRLLLRERNQPDASRRVG